MCTPAVHHRLPRAGVDTISCAETALLTLAMAIQRPLRAETVTLLLDDQRRGIAVAVVSGTRQPDDVLEVVECFTRSAAHGGRVGSIIVASVRPEPSDDATSAADVDRWLEMSDIAEQAGVELLEWFVIGGDVRCPRDQLGEPPRW
jgi:DNA repair protein RadC